MEILKFSLGVRFDLLKDEVSEDDVNMILNELVSVFTIDEVSGLHFYGGTFKLNERDSSGIYTVVIMNGKLKRMRHVYEKLNNDAHIRSLLDHRIPFVQNNVIRRFDGFEYFGAVDESGSITQGSGRKLVFNSSVPERLKFSDAGSIILAPNSFKGTISQDEAIVHLMRFLREKMPYKNLIPIPLADGGDGTLSALENAVLSVRRSAEVTAPYGEKIRADYLVIDGTDAIIESALASGLALCDSSALDPTKATSFGTGELILRAAHEGIRNIYVCLGGSATNDCGIGMANALGVRFLDKEGNEIGTAGEMVNIRSIDASTLDAQVIKSHIIVVCDVKNRLTGIKGATHTFGPQKGADESMIELLEAGMLNMEKLLNTYCGSSVCSNEGAGAAGGMAAMLMALFGAEFKSGAQTILSIAEFDSKLEKASLVITGEGMIDSTTLDGKAVGEVISHAKSANVPVALIAGCKGSGAEKVLELVKYAEFTNSMEDPLTHFDDAAKRLADKL